MDYRREYWILIDPSVLGVSILVLEFVIAGCTGYWPPVLIDLSFELILHSLDFIGPPRTSQDLFGFKFPYKILAS